LPDIKQPFERLDYLDSSRGIAAIIVLIYHVNEYIFHYILDENAHSWILTSHVGYFLAIFINGTNAVSYFFVLSGFVLAYSFLKSGQQPKLIEFYTKRVFRILPLYVVVILIAIAMNYNKLPDTASVVKELLLLPDVHILVPPGWSLTVELLCSFFIPVLILIIQRRFNWFIALLMMTPFLFGYLNTFITHFMLGVLLADLFCKNKIVHDGKPVHEMSTVKTLSLFVVGFLFYALQPIYRGSNSLVDVTANVLSFFRSDVPALYMISSGIGSAIFLFLILRNQNVKALLQHRLLTFLGRISFGVYLVQWILIYFVLPTIISAAILYRLIELPFIKMGRTAATTVSDRVHRIYL
jgi:peptidoglycan/LPS O-acetylase OafA/YrhL